MMDTVVKSVLSAPGVAAIVTGALVAYTIYSFLAKKPRRKCYSLGVPEVSCRVHKQKKNTYTQQNVDSKSLPSFQLLPPLASRKSYYGIRIVTGRQEGAGTTDTDVYIMLFGSKASSGKIELSSILTALKGSYNQRTYDDLLIESDGDLGNILVVGIGNEKEWFGDFGAPWYVDFVMVHNFQSNGNDEFPVYHWIGDGDFVTCTAHTTTPKDVANDRIFVQQRKDQLERRRQKYRWLKLPDVGMPSGIDDGGKTLITANIPPDEKFERVKLIDFTNDALSAAGALGLKTLFTSLDSLHDYEELATRLGVPEVQLYQTSRWATDVEFGRQMLNGVNPVVIRKISSLPGNFPVTNEMVQGSLHGRNATLEKEMKAGRVYLCDLKAMDGLPLREGYYAGAPLCLLYVNGNDQLVPIAIQLQQQPGKDNPIFLPTDGRMDWLLAKIYYQSASHQFHQISTHYLSCHAAMEVYGMGTMRQLPDPHPIYKLLRPHFRYTMAINARARATLIADGGIIDHLFAIGGEGRRELMRRGGTSYNIHWTNIKHNTKERGVDDPKTLPGYYYRDDGFRLWNAMESYVRDVVNEFYKSDADVKGDSEIQNWAEDIHSNGFPGYFEAEEGHGFPKQLDSKETLIELCTLIMFTGSAQHSAVNFGQYQFNGFVPNSPTGMRRPPPTKKGADYQDLMESLPDKTTSFLAIAVSNSLSQFSPEEIFLGDLPAERFTEVRVQRYILRFQKALDNVTGEIEQRNKTLDMPYKLLLPSRVPNSITI